MVSATRHLDQLPTTPFPALKRCAPPPLPAQASPIPVPVSRALAKGRLTIELPIAEMSDCEIVEVMAWLGGRASNVHVRSSLGIVERVVKLVRSVRASVRGAMHAGLVWTLARLGEADERRSRLSPP